MHRTSSVFAFVLLSTLSGLSLAWNQSAPFHAKVHHHEFSRVLVDTDGCALKVKLYFDAPAAQYDPGDSPRSYYRFHARLKFDGAPNALSSVFNNAAPGSRMWEGSIDTTADGCWVKTQHKLEGVDIEGCRGRGCTPDAFK
jgi:hypothetical protein